MVSDIKFYSQCVGVWIVIALLLMPQIHFGTVRAQLLYTDEMVEVSISKGSANVTNAQFFVPPEVQTVALSSVKWTNHDDVPHTVTQGKPSNATAAPEFNSGPISPGGTFVHYFDETGTVDYYCSIHPHMVGKVIVNSPGAYT
ncbi:MAG: plastocyanin/azurin family copper-binding protein [Nitrososphaeraceae archaeon]